MRVLLVNPPWKKRRGNLWRIVAGVVPNMGLAALAAYLAQRGHEVHFIDGAAEGLEPGQFAPRVAGRRFDFVGISSSTSVFPVALAVGKTLRQALPEAKVVFGGVHPTACPEEALAQPFVDYVVRGEGEVTFAELLSGRPSEEIEGLSYVRDGQVVHNPDRPLIGDLDGLPWPAYHLLPMDRYRPPLGGYRRLPGIAMITSRGCPGRCTFCYHELWRGKIRARSPRKVYEEISHVMDRYGVREISFYDDTFTALRDNTRELCRLLIEGEKNLSWSCEARADSVDPDTLAQMAQAGCHQICYGVESADEAILAGINKKLGLAEVERAVRWTQQAGIHVRAAFMLGCPGETEQTLKETLRYAMRLQPDVVQFNITTPFPGTQMFEWARGQGLLVTTDWSRYDHSHAVLRLPEAPPDLVERYYQLSHRTFYLRPRYLARRLLGIRSFEELLMNVRAFFPILLRK